MDKKLVKKTLINTALVAIVSTGMALTVAPAHAAEMEKCYGVAKAGKNDCGGPGTGHACAGQQKVDSDPDDWMLLPKGTCERIVGSGLTPEEAKQAQAVKKDA
jgi:uncharacterized membrane protein